MNRIKRSMFLVIVFCGVAITSFILCAAKINDIFGPVVADIAGDVALFFVATIAFFHERGKLLQLVNQKRQTSHDKVAEL